MKIKGLGQLANQLKELKKFTQEIDGSLGEVSFNPFDAESIEQAIVNIEDLINQKAQYYSSNVLIIDLIVNLKESCRQQIIDKATEARLGHSKVNRDVE